MLTDSEPVHLSITETMEHSQVEAHEAGPQTSEKFLQARTQDACTQYVVSTRSIKTQANLKLTQKSTRTRTRGTQTEPPTEMVDAAV
jgi:hypothetical protein